MREPRDELQRALVTFPSPAYGGGYRIRHADLQARMVRQDKPCSVCEEGPCPAPEACHLAEPKTGPKRKTPAELRAMQVKVDKWVTRILIGVFLVAVWAYVFNALGMLRLPLLR